MYTRCPSCRAEISFEPPANIDNLPDGYKHRIKCPSCGVTIGVKIPKVDATATLHPQYQPQYNNAPYNQPYMGGYAPQPRYAAPPVAQQNEIAKPQKKAGTGRNVMMMLFSLIFIALSVVAYLIGNETIKNIPDSMSWLGGIGFFDGISAWQTLCTDIGSLKSALETSGIIGLLNEIAPIFLFTFSGINFIVAFISACGKKYGRAFNFIWSLIIVASALFIVYTYYALICESLGEAIPVAEFLKLLFTVELCLIPAGALLAIVQFLFSLFFLKSLKIKRN